MREFAKSMSNLGNNGKGQEGNEIPESTLKWGRGIKQPPKLQYGNKTIWISHIASRISKNQDDTDI